VDTIVCPSNYSANSFVEPELRDKVKKVSLGSNFKFKERIVKPDSRLRILMVGNAFLRKGTHYLVEAMKFIEDPSAELWIRGDVPEEYRKRINDDRIKIFGSMPINQLFELYENADVFVQPSVDEGFGMTVLEALSFGLPLVLTENVGAKDIVNEKLAEIVPIRDPMALSKAIIGVRNLPGKEFDIERKRILEKYTWNLCAKTLFTDVYQGNIV
jgi:glycosyltransferase involved in cell wall biosynthesis